MSVNINDLATKIGKSGTMNPNRYAVNITPPIQAKATPHGSAFGRAV